MWKLAPMTTFIIYWVTCKLNVQGVTLPDQINIYREFCFKNYTFSIKLFVSVASVFQLSGQICSIGTLNSKSLIFLGPHYEHAKHFKDQTRFSYIFQTGQQFVAHYFNWSMNKFID